MTSACIAPRARRLFAGAALLSLAALPARLAAQAAAWTTVQQQASWYQAFVDHTVTEKSSLWFDGHWRRMGLGAQPQQLLLRPGVQRTIAPGVRVGGGYAYIATAPYGEAPLTAPLREHRLWQQLSLTHRAGPLSVNHRYRLEQRWIASVRSGDGLAPWSYAQRVRYQARAQGPLRGLAFRRGAVQAFAYDELLMPFGHGTDAALRVTQNRLGAGVGVPLGAHQRLDVGYMNLWNALPAPRVNEVNHTLTAAYVWTRTAPPAAAPR